MGLSLNDAIKNLSKQYSFNQTKKKYKKSNINLKFKKDIAKFHNGNPLINNNLFHVKSYK